MKIYIDSDYKCFTIPAEGRREFDVQFFDGKSSAFIEGYRYVPPGETWTRADGAVFVGEMLSPWRDYNILEAAQIAYEQRDAEAIQEIADLVEDVYTNDIKVIGG